MSDLQPHDAPPGAVLDEAALHRLFLGARTHRHWQDRPVPDALLRKVWDLARLPPTSANCSPARIVFVKSPEAKARLKPLLAPDNRRQTMSAPATAIIGYDLEFYRHLPRLYKAEDAKSWFEGKKPASIERAALQNGSLQGAYFIMAARALGLDCGPMGGFDAAAVDRVFFAGTSYRSNFLLNLGYGDPARLGPRDQRFEFDEVCRIL